MPGFLLVGRSGLGALGSLAGDGEVVGKFSGSQGDLMAVEDFVDEGGVDRVRYDH